MDYSSFFNNFWKAGKAQHLTGNETKLYFFLVHSAYETGKLYTQFSDCKLADKLGMARNTLRVSIEGLVEQGLILSMEITAQGSIYHLSSGIEHAVEMRESKINLDLDDDLQTIPSYPYYYSTTTGI